MKLSTHKCYFYHLAAKKYIYQQIFYLVKAIFGYAVCWNTKLKIRISNIFTYTLLFKDAKLNQHGNLETENVDF